VAERFEIKAAASIVADLRRRLSTVRWPTDLGNEDWFYGVSRRYLADLVAYWLNSYDWDRALAEINTFAHYREVIDDFPIHFIREAGRGPKPIALILTHGWPWTFWDYHWVIRPLADPAAFGADPADAFEVIVPSLPGFGFSVPVPRTGMTYWKTADLWHRLMTERLGFERYAAQGGDYGAVIASQLAHKYSASLIGIHVTNAVSPQLFANDRPWDLLGRQIGDLPPEQRARAIRTERNVAAHITTHILDPQTLAYAMHDSPVGMLAWLLERRRSWSDCGGQVERRFSKDDLITTAMIYWITGSFVSSVRYYADSARYPWQPSHDRSPMFEAPAGITLFLNDGASLPNKERLANYNLHFLKERNSGGHFGPAEEPAAVVEDIRQTFRDLR
jgi:pimeloyl-ACP methyl ester carboxylesterase